MDYLITVVNNLTSVPPPQSMLGGANQSYYYDSFTIAFAIFSIILSVVALYFSFYFFNKSKEAQESTDKILATIKESVNLAELATKDLIPHLTQEIELARETTYRYNLNFVRIFNKHLSHTAMTKLEGILNEQEIAPHAQLNIKSDFLNELNPVLDMLGEFSGIKEKALYKEEEKALPLYLKWHQFIQTIEHLQSKFEFLSVRFLREKVFKENPLYQELLQEALDSGILATSRIPNPKQPGKPTLTCKLNFENNLLKLVKKYSESSNLDTEL